MVSGVHENTCGGIHFLKKLQASIYNFTEDCVPLLKFFKSVSRIIRRPKSSKIEDLKAL